MRLERVRRSYHLAGFMTMPAIGVNGGVDDLGIYGGDRRLRTTWMPRYVLPRTPSDRDIRGYDAVRRAVLGGRRSPVFFAGCFARSEASGD
jgi:hypothetical protein